MNVWNERDGQWYLGSVSIRISREWEISVGEKNRQWFIRRYLPGDQHIEWRGKESLFKNRYFPNSRRARPSIPTYIHRVEPYFLFYVSSGVVFWGDRWRRWLFLGPVSALGNRKAAILPPLSNWDSVFCHFSISPKVFVQIPSKSPYHHPIVPVDVCCSYLYVDVCFVAVKWPDLRCKCFHIWYFRR